MALTRYERLIQQVVDQILVDISHTPGGYAYLRSLPPKGRSSKAALRTRWRRKVIQVVMPPTVHNALVKAALDDEGRVDTRGIALVNWLLDHLYTTPHKLFDAWLQVAAPLTTPQQKGKKRAG